MRSCQIVIVLVAGAVLFAAACVAGERASDAQDTWVGTITTEGAATTVINESGSLWGGTATLVEEASIGVESGAEEYLLGEVMGVAASDREIFVVDGQVPALRVYDWNGSYLRDIGHEGQGPGEYRYPTSVGVDEVGRIWLHEPIGTRIVVFEPDGALVATVEARGARGSFVNSMVVGTGGRAWVVSFVRPEDGNMPRRAMTPYDINGVAGEPVLLPDPDERAEVLEARAGDTTRSAVVPFHPRTVVAFAPTGSLMVGEGDTYRFEIRHPDGRRTNIERRWEPVRVGTDEAAAHEQAVLRYLRDMQPDWRWSGPPIPDVKPALSRIVPAASGETWVFRRGPATLDPECDEASFDLDGVAHCWRERRLIDVFDTDGRYLGEVEMPPGLFSGPRPFTNEPMPFIHGADVIARVEDGAGTVMVKRYRLVLPQEGL